MSIVRWNLKEAGGKAPGRGTRTSYKALQTGRVCKTKRSPKLSEVCGVNAADVWSEGMRSYPGRSDRKVGEVNPEPTTLAAMQD